MGQAKAKSVKSGRKIRGEWQPPLAIAWVEVKPLGFGVRPILFHDVEVPSAFRILFYFYTPEATPNKYWSAELLVKVFENNLVITHELKIFPLTIIAPSGFKSTDSLNTRIEQYQLKILSSEIRRLEAIAIRVIVQSYFFNREVDPPCWVSISGHDYTNKELDRIEFQVLRRSSYRKLDDAFYKWLIRVYNQEIVEAESAGRDPNVIQAIQVRHTLDYPESRTPIDNEFQVESTPRKTVERWIREAKIKFPNQMHVPPRKKSAPKIMAGNAIPNNKISTKPRKGES